MSLLACLSVGKGLNFALADFEVITMLITMLITSSSTPAAAALATKFKQAKMALVCFQQFATTLACISW